MLELLHSGIILIYSNLPVEAMADEFKRKYKKKGTAK
jgi:hypothetical protein